MPANFTSHAPRESRLDFGSQQQQQQQQQDSFREVNVNIVSIRDIPEFFTKSSDTTRCAAATDGGEGGGDGDGGADDDDGKHHRPSDEWGAKLPHNIITSSGNKDDDDEDDNHSEDHGGGSGGNSSSSTSSLSASVPIEVAATCCGSCLSGVGRWLIGKLAEDISRSEAWLLITVVLANFLSFCAGSILAPVLPQHLARKMQEFGETGPVKELHVSVAFVLYASTSMIFSLVFGPLIPRFGVTFFYVTGLASVACTNIALGVLDLMPFTSYQSYLFAQCAVRVLEGIAAAAFNTSSHSIIMRVFSRHIDEAFAAVEAAVAISFSLGPVIGSFLVQALGWFWAFFAFGLTVMASLPVSLYVFSLYGSMAHVDVATRHDHLLPLRVAATWKGTFVVFSMVVTTTAYSFIEPTLELFLEEVLKTTYTTAFYFAQAAAFALSALAIAPFVAARSKMGTMILGTTIQAVGFLLVGPCRYLFREPDEHATMAGVIMLGLGFALSYVPTLDFLVGTAVHELGYTKGASTYGPISGLWNFLNGFGETFGPVIAMFQRSPDIRDATIIFATTLFICAMILMLICFLVSIETIRRGNALEKQAFLPKPHVQRSEVQMVFERGGGGQQYKSTANNSSRIDDNNNNNNNNDSRNRSFFQNAYESIDEFGTSFRGFFGGQQQDGRRRRSKERPKNYERV